MPIFEISAKTEEGFEPWLEWLVGIRSGKNC